MPGRFTGKVALVTGGASGLGKGIARRLAEEAATVVIAGRNEPSMRSTQDEFRAAGLPVTTLLLDVTDEESVASALLRLIATHRRLDIVVNSAGIVGPTHITTPQYPTGDFINVVRINLTGSFLVAKHALPYLIKADAGRLLFMASMSGRDGNPGMMGYTAAKSGLFGLIKALGKEYADSCVTINGLAPAVVRTPLVDMMDPAQVAYLTRLIPMNRPGTIEEVAALSAWIVSAECTFTTGFVFDLSGGRSAY